MILIKSPREIEAMRRAGAVVGQFFEEVRPLIRPGVSTWELEMFADGYSPERGRDAFKGYMGYPRTSAPPSTRRWCTASPRRTGCAPGGGHPQHRHRGRARRLLRRRGDDLPGGAVTRGPRGFSDATERSLAAGIAEARPGTGWATSRPGRPAGGRGERLLGGPRLRRPRHRPALHEEPQIPNFGQRGTGPVLQARDGPGHRADGQRGRGGGGPGGPLDGGDAGRKLSAHFEHTVAITEDGPGVLSLP